MATVDLLVVFGCESNLEKKTMNDDRMALVDLIEQGARSCQTAVELMDGRFRREPTVLLPHWNVVSWSAAEGGFSLAKGQSRRPAFR